MSRRTPKRPAVKQRFNIAPQANIQRSTFDRSHGHKTTFSEGFLVPILVDEVLPGDSFSCRMAAFARLSTPLHPTLDNLWLESFFFFCPNRILWDNWTKFMGEQDNPGDSTDYTVPSTTSGVGGFASSSIYDFFGLPVGVQGVRVCALPQRAYREIFNTWFRDENLQDSLVNDKGDGPDTPTGFGLVKRGKRRDYLTSALPWPQKGDSVPVPLGDTAPVLGIGATSQSFTNTDTAVWESDGTATIYPDTIGNPSNIAWEGDSIAGTSNYLNIRADLSQATGTNINELRQAFQIQKLQERDARGGTRYQEILKSHFQVDGADHRLQRPEYLGGGRTSIQMQTIPQTSSTDATTPQGNVAAYATGTIRGHGFTKSFVEHGWILGLVNVRADLTYQQGVDRMWSRQTKYDYYWPALQSLGEQPVYNREIWVDGTGDDAQVWGYQERWAEYRWKPSRITNDFRSQGPAASLDPWHYSIDFATRPALNATFIEDDPPIGRTVAVPEEARFLMDAWFDYKCARPMPVYSVPGYIDHF